MRTNINTIDKKKMLAHLVSSLCKRLSKYFNENGRQDLSLKYDKYTSASAISDISDISAISEEYATMFIEAYIYAGGKKSSLRVKNLDALTLKNIQKDKNSLQQDTWHACGTTHCRGGWYVVVAKAQELEDIVGNWGAAAMIAMASTGTVPNFYDMDNAAVLNDIKACAARSQS